MPGDANSRQVGGNHYQTETTVNLQHWDIVHIFGLDYFQGNITKYIFRWRKKGGIQDLEKARHYLDKYIEIQKAGILLELKEQQSARLCFCGHQLGLHTCGTGPCSECPDGVCPGFRAADEDPEEAGSGQGAAPAERP